MSARKRKSVDVSAEARAKVFAALWKDAEYLRLQEKKDAALREWNREDAARLAVAPAFRAAQDERARLADDRAKRAQHACYAYEEEALKKAGLAYNARYTKNPKPKHLRVCARKLKNVKRAKRVRARRRASKRNPSKAMTFGVVPDVNEIRAAMPKRTRATKRNPSKAMAKLFLWKLDQAIGTWKLQREVTEETGAEWLRLFQKDEPSERFIIAAKKPVTQAEKELRRQVRTARTKRRTRKNPRVTLTYGHVPSFAQIKKAVGSEPFTMRLNDRDARTVERVGFEGGDRLDAHGVYELVELLSEEYERAGDDEAGDLASSILAVLGIEWV